MFAPGFALPGTGHVLESYSGLFAAIDLYACAKPWPRSVSMCMADSIHVTASVYLRYFNPRDAAS